MKKFFALLLAALLLTGCSSGLQEQITDTTGQPVQTTAEPTQTTAPVQEVRPTAPDFTVYDREGNEVKLSDFLGKPVVLNFWASWCGPCKSEMPHFQQAWEQYGDEVAFLMVNLTDGQGETAETAYSYIDGCCYTFPVYCDTTSEAAYTYGIYSIPTTFFIHADGTAEGYISGAMDLETLEMAIGLIME